MYGRCAVAIAMSVACLTHSQAAERAEFQLGGPRQVVAIVVEEDGYFQVTVRLLPVRCFDPSLNTQLTREKAMNYAQLALARKLAGNTKGAVALSVSHVEIEDFQMEGRQAKLAVRIPQKAVGPRQSGAGKKSDAKFGGADRELLNARNLFEAKADQLATLKSLSRLLKFKAKELRQQNQERDAFYQAVADHEEVADQSFRQFHSAVETDKLLLAAEREELLHAAAEAKEEFLTWLRRQVKQFEVDTAEN